MNNKFLNQINLRKIENQTAMKQCNINHGNNYW